MSLSFSLLTDTILCVSVLDMNPNMNLSSLWWIGICIPNLCSNPLFFCQLFVASHFSFAILIYDLNLELFWSLYMIYQLMFFAYVSCFYLRMPYSYSSRILRFVIRFNSQFWKKLFRFTIEILIWLPRVYHMNNPSLLWSSLGIIGTVVMVL